MSKRVITIIVIMLAVGALLFTAHSLDLPALLIKMHGG